MAKQPLSINSRQGRMTLISALSEAGPCVPLVTIDTATIPRETGVSNRRDSGGM
jgi:hypothetical protein